MKSEIVDKGWGYEEILINNTLYCAKILHINKDKKLSWHYHNVKDETFYVENGKVKLLFGWAANINTANLIILKPGDTFHIPKGLIHRLIALENSRVFEFSTQHFDLDTVRIERGD